MDAILADLARQPRVVGALVCDAGGELLAVAPRGLAGAREAARLGRTVSAAGAGPAGQTNGTLELCFENGKVLILPVGTSASLVVVGEPNAEVGLEAERAAAALGASIVPLRLSAGRRGEVDLGARVKAVVQEMLGSRADKPLALVAAAGGSPEKLAAAGAEAVRFARLFLGKDRAEELRGRLREAIGRDV